jgi:hypothetical protein
MAATAKAAANSNVEARLATLRDDQETLQKDIKGLAGEVGGVASNRANEALKAAEKLAAVLGVQPSDLMPEGKP